MGGAHSSSLDKGHCFADVLCAGSLFSYEAVRALRSRQRDRAGGARWGPYPPGELALGRRA